MDDAGERIDEIAGIDVCAEDVLHADMAVDEIHLVDGTEAEQDAGEDALEVVDRDESGALLVEIELAEVAGALPACAELSLHKGARID